MRRAQEELNEVKARYYDLFDHAPAGYCTLSDKGLILEANLTAATLLGLEPGTLVKRSFFSCVFPEDTDTLYLRLKQIAQTGGQQNWEVRMVRSDGTLLWVLLQASAAQAAQGRLEYRIVLNDLTASRKTQEVLLKISTAVEQSPTSIVITDISGAIEYVNPKFTEMTGYALTEVLGKTPSILKSGYSTPEAYQELWDTISAGRTWHGEFRNRKKNGDLFWEDAGISPVRNAQGVLVGYVGVKEDITERKHAEAVLRESEAKWRALFEILPVGLSILDDQHGLKEFNPALTRILQIDPEAMRRGAYVQRKYLRADGTALPREELPSVRAAQEQAAFRSFEIGVQTEGGDLIWTEVNAAPLNVPGYSTVLTTTDITERKRIEDALRTRETMLARTEAIAHVGSWERDVATGSVTWSEEMFRILQRDPAAGTPTFAELADFYHPEDMAQLRHLTDVAVQEGTPFELELRVLLPEGETKTCLARGHTEAGPDGKAVRLFGSLLDITRSKQLETGLRRSEAALNKAQRFAKVGSWTWHIKSNRLDWSEEMYRLFGIARETFTGVLTDVVAQGLARRELRTVPLKPEEMRQAIRDRSVDAVCTWNYPLSQIERDLGITGAVFYDREIYTETFNIAVAREVLDGRPEAVQAFLRALIKAEQFVARQPEEAQVIVASATAVDQNLIREVWDAFNYSVRLDQTLLITLEDETRWAIKQKLTEQAVMPDYRKIIHEDSLLAIKAAAVKSTR